jgi:hypothetical protein
MSAQYDFASAVAGTFLAISGAFAFVGLTKDATAIQTVLLAKCRANPAGKQLSDDEALVEANKRIDCRKKWLVAAWIVALASYGFATYFAFAELG